MKMLDCVEVVVEKDKYAKEGVHKGMQGVIWEADCKHGAWVVLIPQCGEKEDIADLYIEEKDLKPISVMNAAVNEEIKARFEDSGENAKSFSGESDLSDYMV